MERVCTNLWCSAFVLALVTVDLYGQSNFVYTNNNSGVFPSSNNTVSAFSVATNGVLTAIPGSPFQTGDLFGIGGSLGGINILVVGNHLYIPNANSISVFSINATDGGLALLQGSPFPVNVFNVHGPFSLAATPDGRFLMAGDSFSTDTISVFTISADGSLSPILGSPFANRGPVTGMKVTPDGRFLAVAVLGGVAMYSIDPNGGLTLVPGSPFARPPFFFIRASVEINCASDLLFACNTDISSIGLPTVDVFRIGQDGSLSQIGSSPPIAGFGDNVSRIFLGPNDQNLFLSDSSVIRALAVLNVSSNGSLTVVPGSPFSIGTGLPLNVVPTGMVTNSQGTLLYAALSPNFVGVYSVGSNGALNPVPGSPFSLGFPPAVTSVAAYPPKSCGPTFDICIQDDSTGSVFKFNSTTGDYQFTNCSGFTLGGTGSLIKRGGLITLQHYAVDRRVLARIDTSVNKGTASIQVFSLGTTFTITDRNTTNNTCACTAH